MTERASPGIDVDAVRAGDEHEFRRLVAMESARMLRLARIFAPTREAAEDAVQDAWIAVIKGLPGFEGRAAIGTWICRITINTARRCAGRDARTVPMPFSDLSVDGQPAVPPERFWDHGPSTGHWRSPPDDWSQLPEQQLLSDEMRGVFEVAIDALPPAQRLVIVLRDVYEMSTAETADIVQLSVGNVRVLLHRARSQVRSSLERYLAAS